MIVTTVNKTIMTMVMMIRMIKNIMIVLIDDIVGSGFVSI